MNEPNRPGLFIFDGIRRTPNRSGIVTVRDVVEVRSVRWRREEELAAFFIGRQMPYPVRLFEGTWEPLRLDLGGERCS